MSAADRDAQGYRAQPGHGPRVRSDVVDVYVVKRGGARAGRGAWRALQVRRAKDPLRGMWQPVMGHIEAGETALQAGARELREEVGLCGPGAARGVLLGAWALEQVHPFYLAAIDCIVLSPRLLVHVAHDWEPALNAEHDAARWVPLARAERWFMWPGQAAALREAQRYVLNPRAEAHRSLRVAWPG